jgi:hypothetical protein
LQLVIGAAEQLPTDKRHVLLQRLAADLERRGNINDADVMEALATAKRDLVHHSAA